MEHDNLNEFLLNLIQEPWRSEWWTRQADGQSCVCCGAQDKTVVLAHLPMMGVSQGGFSKCDDFWGADLCRRCHDLADSEHYRQDVYWRSLMLKRTLRRRLDAIRELIQNKTSPKI